MNILKERRFVREYSRDLADEYLELYPEATDEDIEIEVGEEVGRSGFGLDPVTIIFLVRLAIKVARFLRKRREERS